jgi:hypothetical protein
LACPSTDAMCHWRHPRRGFLAHARESKACASLSYVICVIKSVRWLIDVGRDAEGLRVLADLHGGDPEHPDAVAEFEEIQNTIAEFVCV